MDRSELTARLDALRDATMAEAAEATDVATLEAVGVEVLGKKGRLTEVLRGIGALAPEDRPVVGAAANAVREAIEAALDERRVELRSAELETRLFLPHRSGADGGYYSLLLKSRDREAAGQPGE